MNLNSNNHPTREELTRHVFSETAGGLRAQLEAHLGECPKCAKDVADMQETLCRLDQWEIPPTHPRRHIGWQPVRWAAAAAILLGVGLGIGRFTAPATANLSTLRAEIKTDLERTVATEIRNQLRAAMHAELQTAFTSAREDDRAYTLALFKNLQREHEDKYVSLRKDLETLATLTEDELLNARRSIFQVAAFAQSSTDEEVLK